MRFCGGNGAEEIQLTVTGPLGKPVKSSYAVLRETNTAVIETASAVGLTYIPSELRNPLYTTSRGAGGADPGCLGQGAARENLLWESEEAEPMTAASGC